MKINQYLMRVRCIETEDQKEESLINEYLDDKGRYT